MGVYPEICYGKLGSIKTIEKLRNGYTIKDVAKEAKLVPYEVIDYLYENSFNEENKDFINSKLLEHYSSYKIDGDSFIAIGDTHIGRKIGPYEYTNGNIKKIIYRNEELLYKAYDTAREKGIKTIIHLGDIMEGLCDGHYTNKMELEEQIEYLHYIYPNCDDIKTYLLLGNHDYNELVLKRLKYPQIFTQGKNIEIVGVDTSYINFNGEFVKLLHPTRFTENNKFYEIEPQFTLRGHSHVPDFISEERKYILPSITKDDFEDYMGFLEVIDSKTHYTFKRYDKDAKIRNIIKIGDDKRSYVEPDIRTLIKK